MFGNDEGFFLGAVVGLMGGFTIAAALMAGPKLPETPEGVKVQMMEGRDQDMQERLMTACTANVTGAFSLSECYNKATSAATYTLILNGDKWERLP